MESSTRHVFLRVTSPLAGLNFTNQAARTIIATMGPLLALEFELSATELGMLSAVFYFAYAAAQLPAGVAMDLFGVRRVQVTLACIAAVGFFLCAMATGPVSLAVGRFVTGFGVSVGMIAMLTAHAHWVPREKVAAMTGAGVFLASFGGLSATLPAHWLLPLLGWRGLFGVLAVLALLVAVTIWFVVPERQAVMPAKRGLGRELAEYGRIFRHPEFRRAAPAVAMLSTLFFTYGGLWAGPWLRDAGGFGDTARATLLAVFSIGAIVGALLTGQAVSLAHRRGWGAMAVPIAALALVLVVQLLLLWLPSREFWFVAALWFTFTFATGAGPGGYAAVAQRFPPELAGRVGTAMNFSMLVLTFVLQNAIGWILDLWPRTASGGWDAAGYRWAWGVTILLQVVAMGLLLFPYRLKR